MQETKAKKIDGKRVTFVGPLLQKPADGRCNGCGACCLSSSMSDRIFQLMKECLDNPPEEGCPFMGENGCKLGMWIPFTCVKSVCTHYEGCSERLVGVSEYSH